jgi:hypothetical protein
LHIRELGAARHQADPWHVPHLLRPGGDRRGDGERTAWRATQRAAWAALVKVEE